MFPVLGWWQTRVMPGGDSGAGPGAGLGRRWDVALSFAGAQREYVERVASALKARGVRCFYDADEQVELWGRHLAEELPRIYAEESAAVVVFVSADYAAGGWTRLERRAAFSRAVAEAGAFVLPARFDDSELPGLLDDVVSVDLRGRTPEQFADLVAARLGGLAASPAGRPRAQSSAGWPLAEVADPFALEVHRPVQPEDVPAGLPELPVYVRREHDEALGQVVRAAAAGRSGVAVLVGGSSTGKTRACWEALGLLRDRDPPWRLWHPIDPSRPDAALAELPRIGPRTVVWLNEAQFYLGPAELGLGERVAAGLRELLRDPARAPVLVLATLWPQFWDTLTTRPGGGGDPHAQARELLAGHDITVPAAFTAAQVAGLARAGDVRLVLAARSAAGGQVVQFLAGAPELLARYRNAPPAARAVIEAAMDARRLGMGAALPYAFLEVAAPGYLTDDQWDGLGEDWLEQALAYAAVPCKGARGPLTRIRSRPGSSRPARQAGRAGGRGYRLADWLDQHGRARRAGLIPPAEFWAAAAACAAPGDQAALGAAAAGRGLYRAAAQLHKNAAVAGDLRAAAWLAQPPGCLRADPRPAHWAVAHASLDDPVDVGMLLDRLRWAGEDGQAAALAARAAHVLLDHPGRVGMLLDRLRWAGEDGQVAALAARAAAHAPLDHPYSVAILLDELRWAGEDGQVAALAARAAAHAPLDDPEDVAALLRSLREAGADEQAAALLARDPAARVALDDPEDVAILLRGLQGAGEHGQAAALAARAAAHAPLDHPYSVAILLDELREAGADEQAAALAARAAAHAPLDHPDGVAVLLDSLREAGANEQAAALAARAAAHAPLDDLSGVAILLGRLRGVGAGELAARAAARVALDEPYGVAVLLDGLREAGADEQAAALLARDPAARVALDHPSRVAVLLDGLREAGADEQAAALLARDPAARVALDEPYGVANLLRSLRGAGEHGQAAALAARAAAHASLDNLSGVAVLLDRLREAGADEQAAALVERAAARTPLDHPDGVANLLDELREAGADEQAAALAARLPAAGLFRLFLEQEGRADQFRFGREPDGTPAAPWDWDDLDLPHAPQPRRGRKGECGARPGCPLGDRSPDSLRAPPRRVVHPGQTVSFSLSGEGVTHRCLKRDRRQGERQHRLCSVQHRRTGPHRPAPATRRARRPCRAHLPR